MVDLAVVDDKLVGDSVGGWLESGGARGPHVASKGEGVAIPERGGGCDSGRVDGYSVERTCILGLPGEADRVWRRRRREPGGLGAYPCMHS